MEGVLTQFLSIQTIIFVLIVYLAVGVFRKAVEVAAPKIAYIFPDKWEPWWVEFWKEWVLLTAPAVMGGLIAFFITGYPYPEVFAGSVAGRVFFGIVGGLCANNTFKFFNYYIKKLLPKRVEAEHKKIASAASPPATGDAPIPDIDPNGSDDGGDDGGGD